LRDIPHGSQWRLSRVHFCLSVRDAVVPGLIDKAVAAARGTTRQKSQEALLLFMEVQTPDPVMVGFVFFSPHVHPRSCADSLAFPFWCCRSNLFLDWTKRTRRLLPPVLPSWRRVSSSCSTHSWPPCCCFLKCLLFCAGALAPRPRTRSQCSRPFQRFSGMLTMQFVLRQASL